MAENNVMLTTVDNPWNPFTNFDEWNQYDEASGWYTLALLGRVTISSDELSEADQDVAIQDAMTEIIQENVSGVHILVTPESERFQER